MISGGGGRRSEAVAPLHNKYPKNLIEQLLLLCTKFRLLFDTLVYEARYLGIVNDYMQPSLFEISTIRAECFVFCFAKCLI